MKALAPAELQVATFNVHHGVGLDGVLDIERTAAAIRDTGATVVALQELDRFVPRSGMVDQAEVLSQLTGLTISFHPTMKLRDGEYGIGIGAPDSLDTEYASLARTGDEEPRGVIVALGYGFAFVAAHLSHDKDARAQQTIALAELAALPSVPTVVMGDLNQGASDLGPLVAAGFHLGPRRRTIGRRFSRRQLDHIAAGNGARLEGTWTVRTTASDHLPLVGLVLV